MIRLASKRDELGRKLFEYMSAEINRQMIAANGYGIDPMRWEEATEEMKSGHKDVVDRLLAPAHTAASDLSNYLAAWEKSKNAYKPTGDELKTIKRLFKKVLAELGQSR